MSVSSLSVLSMDDASETVEERQFEYVTMNFFGLFSY